MTMSTVAPFPPPLRGPRRATLALEVRERGGVIGTARENPSPQPSPARGEGALAFVLTSRDAEFE